MGGAKQAPVSMDRSDAIVNTYTTIIYAYKHLKDREVSIQPQTEFADQMDLLAVTYQHG